MKLYRVTGRCELREGDYLLRMEAGDMPGSLGIKVSKIARDWVEVVQVTGFSMGEQAWAVKRLSFGDTIGRDTLGMNVRIRVERGESRNTAVFDISYPSSP